jgi:hypothetical protein
MKDALGRGSDLILKSPDEVTPIDATQFTGLVNSWVTALAILDKSELALRDVIERELSNTAGLGHLRYGDAMSVADRLMKKVTRIRTKALKAAFRLVRGAAL